MPVKTTLTDGRVPVKIWTDDVEPQALAQLTNTARLPFVFKHVAAMPDVHLGKGATVGSVIATKGAVCPAAVGVDIGCGMMAVKTSLDAREVQDALRTIYRAIVATVPVGTEANRGLSDEVRRWSGWAAWDDLHAGRGDAMRKKAMAQLGSLGGGNHFIEICIDEAGAVWVMLHSGSRHVGNAVAQAHIDGAKSDMKRMAVALPDPDLAYFVEGTPAFARYLWDLHWCQDYAAENRREMMRRVLHDLAVIVNHGAPVPVAMEVNCHHNYVARETHFGEEVLVTRKGAVRAGSGEFGIIPGSMGSRSYVVRGLGNPESFSSCSHGAGRRMSRNQAAKAFSVADLKRQTEGVLCRKDRGVLDEIPAAYKDIDQVMAQSHDLVEVVAVLKQILCVKG